MVQVVLLLAVALASGFSSKIAGTVSEWVGPPGSRPGTYQEWVVGHPFDATLGASFKAHVPASEDSTYVGLYVDSTRRSDLDTMIRQLSADLSSQGLAAVVNWVDPQLHPESLKALIESDWISSSIEGALLIGDIPVAWYQQAGDHSANYGEWPCDLFYMDLDGVWLDSLKRVYGVGGDTVLVPGIDSMYDVHRGDVAPEVYVARIMPTGLLHQTTRIQEFLQKVHLFRQDSIRLWQRALHFCDDDWDTVTAYHIPLVSSYRDTALFLDPETTVARIYRRELLRGHSWVGVFAHSGPEKHRFVYNGGASETYFSRTDYDYTNPPANFYNFFACSFSRFTEEDEGCGANHVLFNSNYAVGAIGTTKTGGMQNYEWFFDSLAPGMSVGRAYLAWFNRRLQYGTSPGIIEWYYGLTLMGDPFLAPILGHDAYVREVLRPTGYSDTTTSLAPAVVVRNAGFQPETVAVLLVVSLADSTFYADSILGVEVSASCCDTFEFDTLTFGPGHYSLLARVSAVTDENVLNDSALMAYDVAQAGWSTCTDVPDANPMKKGGLLVYDPRTAGVYCAKGRNRFDFWRFDPNTEDWSPCASVPSGDRNKGVKLGSAGCADGLQYIYVTKGNCTSEFYRYNTLTDAWQVLPDVPTGESGKKVRRGTSMVYVLQADTGYVYLLKGDKCEFYRFNTVAGTWDVLPDAPHGISAKFDKGSWLVDGGNGKLYAHKSKYHELSRFDLAGLVWDTMLAGMPRFNGQTGKTRKSKDGGSAVVLDGLILALKGYNTQDFYGYSIDGDSWIELDTVPQLGSYGTKKRVGDGGAIVAVGSRLYVTKGKRTNEFWRYVPPPSGAFGPCAASPRCAVGPAFGSEDAVFDGYDAERPRWNSTGTAVTYFREDSASGCNAIFVVADGKETQLTFEPTDCENPVFRPGGNEIGFQMLDTVTGCWQICFVPLGSFEGDAAGEVTAAVPTSADAASADPSAQADAPVALVASPGRPQRGGRSNGTFGTIYQLTFDERDHENPEWSPDGEWLVCTVEDTTGYAQILRVKMDGSYEEQLTFDEADHEWPKYLTEEKIVYQHGPDDDYDQVCVFDLGSQAIVQLTDGETDFEKPDPSIYGDLVAYQALDDDGTYQIGQVSATGDNQQWLSYGGDLDIEEPDFSPDGVTVYAVRWQGLTSEIGWVGDAATQQFEPITDDDYIRDNPDAAFNSILCVNSVIYERENPSPTYGDGPRRRKPGTGIYLTRHKRKPNDGEQTAAGFRLALERAEPNPARTALTIHWQVPTRQPVSLRVYNTAGRLVRVLEEGERAPGRYSTRWNGRDDEGRRLAAGVYFYALEAGERRLSMKLVLTD